MDYRVEFFNLIFEGRFEEAYEYMDCLDDLADDDIRLILYNGEYLNAMQNDDQETKKQMLDNLKHQAIKGHDASMFYYGLFASQNDDKFSFGMVEEAISLIINKRDLDFLRLNIIGYYYHILMNDFKKAIPYYEKSAQDGCFESIFLLAEAYENGLGVRKNNKKAFKYHLLGANLGLESSMISVSGFYKEGLGVKKNIKESLKWMRKAAKKKNPIALYNLGVSYNVGDIVPKNEEKAFRYFKEAASYGVPSAMHNVAIIYQNKNQHKKAFNWFKEAARNDIPESMFELAHLYEAGIGTKKNKKEALFWYNEAYEHGMSYAKTFYTILKDEMEYGLDVALVNLEKASALEGNVEAMRFLADYYFDHNDDIEVFKYTKMASELGDDTSLYNLGRIYELGLGTDQNIEKALECYNKANRKNNIHATLRLAELYYTGLHVPKNSYTAIKYLKQAKDLGSKDAIYNLGVICEEDLKMNDEAFFWFKEAAEKGQADAINRLGEIYMSQNKVSDAVSLFDKSSHYGCAKALYNLGLCYEKGIGKNKSFGMAKKYFTKAYKKGFKEAKERIDELKEDNFK